MRKELIGLHLRRLRERAKLSPNELAAQTGSHATTIYKAESGDSCKIETIRHLYYGLCQDEEEWVQVLIRWALAQDGGRVSIDQVNKGMLRLRDKQSEETNHVLDQFAKILRGVNVADRELLLQFARNFSQSPHARALVRAWMEGVSAMNDTEED